MNIAFVFCRTDYIFNSYPAGVFQIFESNPPLGLGAIATVAAKYGCNVKVYDQFLLNQNNTELLVAIEQFNPDMVGFSCTSLNVENTLFCARHIKERTECVVFGGGIHITLCTQKVLDKDIFDFLISGEGEEVFKIVLESLIHHYTIEGVSVKGLWKKGENEYKGTAVLSEIEPIIIDRSVFDIELYHNRGALLEEKPCYSLFSSRGCPFYCKFCSKPDYFKIYRTREMDQLLVEIHNLVDGFGAKAISFREDNFTVNRERLKLFCERMKIEFDGNLHWECESRADLPWDILKLMHEAGCRGIWCGVETIVPKWSKWINKGITKNEAEEFYHNCNSLGIGTGALFMFGFPYQTRSEIHEDVMFAMKLPTKFSAFQCMAIFPGSPLKPFYYEHPGLKHDITDDVSLALIQGYSYKEMIEMEHDINHIIRSNREGG